MKRIEIIDTTVRDAQQCLWATRMRTAHMLPVAEKMDRCGFAQMDVAGPLQFEVCVRYLKEDPWERVRLLRQRFTRTPLRSIVRSRYVFSFDLVPDDITELWVERLVANGFSIIGSFDGLNDVDNILVGLRAAQRLGVPTYGTLSYALSPVHTDELYVRVAKELIERGKVGMIMLKDASGLLTVDRIRTLVPALKQAIGDVPLELHSHCLTGLAPLVYLEGVKAGVDVIDCSIAPMANGPAQPATQAMARDLRLDGYEVAVDDALLDEVGEHFRRVAEQEGQPLGEPAAYNAFHYQHQVPGGMVTNLQAQLAQAGLSDRHDEIVEECARVRTELAYPIMITPFAQIVGIQALMNVMHGERYRIVPDTVKKYALGHYGKLLAAIDPNLMDRIIGNGSPRISANPEPLPPAVPALRKRYPNCSDDERLLRFLFHGNQVDEMLAAGPMNTEFSYEKPIVRLLKELEKRRHLARVHVRRQDFNLDLTYGG